ncbi:hypothetical protein K470DRAFT_78839 [Piedraia hortae CBS 480.64]|uniref:Uncharacterized protein n=1 Tax=Piedraia hortae CBS 480.64 TaxID=1314780 RepID=A0A6A7BZY1_9PEZI|nr:hypothetical protein K470DRAFT_78839 [Piedraia hortae CBS 480.64]
MFFQKATKQRSFIDSNKRVFVKRSRRCNDDDAKIAAKEAVARTRSGGVLGDITQGRGSCKVAGEGDHLRVLRGENEVPDKGGFALRGSLLEEMGVLSEVATTCRLPEEGLANEECPSGEQRTEAQVEEIVTQITPVEIRRRPVPKRDTSQERRVEKTEGNVALFLVGCTYFFSMARCTRFSKGGNTATDIRIEVFVTKRPIPAV